MHLHAAVTTTYMLDFPNQLLDVISSECVQEPIDDTLAAEFYTVHVSIVNIMSFQDEAGMSA